jgi:hypothetical protein
LASIKIPDAAQRAASFFSPSKSKEPPYAYSLNVLLREFEVRDIPSFLQTTDPAAEPGRRQGMKKPRSAFPALHKNLTGCIMEHPTDNRASNLHSFDCRAGMY